MPEKRVARSKNEKKKEEPKDLKIGQVVSSSKDSYTVEELLGAGGFGAVYKVHSANDFDKKHALKVEYPDPQANKNRLKVEIVVFAEIAQSPTINKTHFVTMHDKGKTPYFKYIVLDLIGHSLDTIFGRMLNRMMTLSTIIKIGRQTLEAIEALHECGWIHRDIKIANFAIGRPPKDSTIFMLDFGISKKYLDDKGQHILPRKNAPGMGTVLYASRNYHQNREMSRMDDYEVWIYMMVQLFDVRGRLPWSKFLNEKQKTFETKCKFMAEPEIFWKSMEFKFPKKFVDIIKLVDKMAYSDAGDMKTMNRLLDEIVKDEKVDESLPFDWIGKTMPPKPEEPKKNEEKEKDDDHEKIKKKSKTNEKPNKSLDEKRKAMESQLIKLSREMEESKDEVKVDRRRGRDRNDEKKGRRRREKEEYEEGEEDYEDDYSEEQDDKRRRRNDRRKLKSVADDEPNTRKKRGRNRNHRDDREENRRSRGTAGRKKTGRRVKSYGEGRSKLEKYGRKKRSRERDEEKEELAKLPDSPLENSDRDKKRDPDYVCLRTAEDLEQEEDAKEKENSDKRSGYSPAPETDPKPALPQGKDAPPKQSNSSDSK